MSDIGGDVQVIAAGNWPLRPSSFPEFVASPVVRQLSFISFGIAIFVIPFVWLLPKFAPEFKGITPAHLLLAAVWTLVALSVSLFVADRSSGTTIQTSNWEVDRQDVTWTIRDRSGKSAVRHEETRARSLIPSNITWIVAAWGAGWEDYHTSSGRKKVYYRGSRTYYRVTLDKSYGIGNELTYNAGAKLFDAFVAKREWVSVYAITHIRDELRITVQFPAGSIVTNVELVRYRLGLRHSQLIEPGPVAAVAAETGEEGPVVSIAITGAQPKDSYEIWWSWNPEPS